MFNSCLFQLVHLSTPQPSTLLSPGSLPWLRRDPPGFTQVSPDFAEATPRLRRGSTPGFAGSLSRLAVSFLRFALYSFQGALCAVSLTARLVYQIIFYLSTAFLRNFDIFRAIL